MLAGTPDTPQVLGVQAGVAYSVAFQSGGTAHFLVVIRDVRVRVPGCGRAAHLAGSKLKIMPSSATVIGPSNTLGASPRNAG